MAPDGARCLCTLDPLPEEGYTRAAQRRLAGGDRKFPHRVAVSRAEVLTHRAQAAGRMSISGVQEKVSLKLRRGRLELTVTEGEYLLKPAPGAEHLQRRADVPANEHLTMLLAQRVFGIETAVHACIRLGDGELAYVTKRFDRVGGRKVAQEDFCQLLERSVESHGPNYKYDGSYEGLARTLRRFCGAYAVEAERLFQRIVFCYAFSNGDAHLKNFSLFQTPRTGDHVLTPAYDLICTSLHLPDESRLALELFEDDHETAAFQARGFPTGACFLELARRMGLAATRARRLLAPFLEGPRQDVLALIRRSFLTPAAQLDYARRYEDRLAALRAGLEP